MFIAAIVVLGIGLLVLIILAALNRSVKKNPDDWSVSYVVRWPGWLIIVLAVVFFFVSFLKIIPAGHVGIPVVFGKVQERALPEGLRTRAPWSVIETLEIRMQEYTMSIAPEEGAIADRGDEIDIVTLDNMRVKVDATVQWSIDPDWAWWLFQKKGRNLPELVVKIVRPEVRGSMRDGASQFISTDIAGAQRTDYRDIVYEDLKQRLAEEHIVLEDLILRNVALPDSVQDAIEEKQAAFQRIEKKAFETKEAIEEANRKIAEAHGIAESNRIIQADLTEEYLTWYYISTLQQLVDAPNNSVLVMPFDQALIPMINLPSGQ